jgi:hypothetical protein
MVIVGLVGNSQFHPNDFFDTCSDQAKTEKARIESIQPILDQIDYNLTESKTFVSRLTKVGNETVHTVHNARSVVGDKNVWR